MAVCQTCWALSDAVAQLPRVLGEIVFDYAVPPCGRGQFDVGAVVWCMDTEQDWFRGKIINSVPRNGELSVLVHYLGWSAKWDVWIPPLTHSDRILPLFKAGRNTPDSDRFPFVSEGDQILFASIDALGDIEIETKVQTVVRHCHGGGEVVVEILVQRGQITRWLTLGDDIRLHARDPYIPDKPNTFEVLGPCRKMVVW